jgi:hypothetical protein
MTEMTEVDPTVRDALAAWREDTSATDSEAATALAALRELAPADAVAVLEVADELWLYDFNLHGSLRLTASEWVVLVAVLVGNRELTAETVEFRKRLVQLFPTERDAAQYGLELAGMNATRVLPAHLRNVPSSVDQTSLEEARQHCMNVQPGWTWVQVEPLGWVLYRMGNW